MYIDVNLKTSIPCIFPTCQRFDQMFCISRFRVDSQLQPLYTLAQSLQMLPNYECFCAIYGWLPVAAILKLVDTITI